MDHKNKKILTYNIIKFVIWIGLLWLAFWYLQTHPAEQRSRNTWMQIIFDKVWNTFQKIGGNYDPINEYKKNMISSFSELIFIADTTNCITWTMKDDLYKTFEDLQTESIEHFTQYKDNYYLVWSEYREHIEKTCDKK